MGSCFSLGRPPPRRRNPAFCNNRPNVVIVGSPRYSNNNPMCNPYRNGPQFYDTTFMVGSPRHHRHRPPPPVLVGGRRGRGPVFCDPNPRFC